MIKIKKWKEKIFENEIVSLVITKETEVVTHDFCGYIASTPGFQEIVLDVSFLDGRLMVSREYRCPFTSTTPRNKSCSWLACLLLQDPFTNLCLIKENNTIHAF